jgi:putative transposase
LNEPGHAHALTFSCEGRRALLEPDRAKQLLIEGLSAARRKKGFDLWAYVIMPEHVHLLIWPRERPYSISAILKAIKQPVSFRAREAGLTEGVSFWLPGGGFDRNLTNPKAVHAEIEYMHANPVRRGLCVRPTDWGYSSARFWAGLDGVVLEMDRTLPSLG